LLEQSGNDLFCCQERDMFNNLVTYHIHQAALLPPNDAQAYQYILAANGLFVRAETRFWQACILVAACEVRGLQPLQPRFVLKIGCLPASLLAAAIADARQQRRDGGGLNEALYQFRHDGHQVRLVRPAQQATASQVQTRQPPPPDLILELHSHGKMPAHQTHYQAVAGKMGAVVGDFSDRVETADWWRTPDQTAPAIGRRLPAHCFATLDGMPVADALPFSQQLGRTVRAETSLAPAVGIAPHKFTAQIAASLARIHHIRPVEPGAEREFLAACPLRFLPLDGDTGRRLHLLGIRTLGDLAALPPTAVQTQFGREVARWQRWARGQDETPVRPAPAERVETITYRFDDPLTSLVDIDHLIQQVAQALAARLQTAALQTGCVSLAWQTERDQQQHQTQRLHQPTAAANRLTLALTHLFDPDSLAEGLTELTVSLSDLTPAVPQQLSLFAPPARSRKGDDLLYGVTTRYPASRFYRPVLAANGHPLPERRFQLHPVAAPPSPTPCPSMDYDPLVA
jgi:nucleotidyltransferase/DNA polymerase involved in DNA repair